MQWSIRFLDWKMDMSRNFETRALRKQFDRGHVVDIEAVNLSEKYDG